MYMNSLAFAYSLAPPSVEKSRRTLYTTVLFAAGAIIGWPFSLAISIPFVFEEFFVRGADRIKSGKWAAWFYARVLRLFTAGMCAACLFVRVLLCIKNCLNDYLDSGRCYRFSCLWAPVHCTLEHR